MGLPWGAWLLAVTCQPAFWGGGEALMPHTGEGCLISVELHSSHQAGEAGRSWQGTSV